MSAFLSNKVFSNISKFSREVKPLVSLRGITKKFPGVIALDNVSLDIYPGEILALLGENGAGKSTLVKILYGLYTPDKGEVIVYGEKTKILSPRHAVSKGIVLVPQTPHLIDSLSVLENLIIGLREYGVFARVNLIEDRVREIASSIGIELDPRKPVATLSYTQKQLVSIIRALLLKARVLLVDEATTLLPSREKEKFYTLFRRFTEGGGSVVLITHKVVEALRVADRIAVLKSGRLVGVIDRDRARVEDVRKLMFGKTVANNLQVRLKRTEHIDGGKRVLEVMGLWVSRWFGDYVVRGVSLSVRRGEVVGIAGIAGNGQEELVQAIVGLVKPVRGSIRLLGVDVTGKGVELTRKLGLGYIPDIPMRYGVSIDNTIEENIAALLVRGKIIKWRRVNEFTSKLIREYDVKAPHPRVPVKVLSGGNLMKVLVSRELAIARSLLVAHNPTRALDEVSARLVRRMIREKAVGEGIGVLLVSEDLDEVLELSDRILVINSGRIVGVFDANRVERERIEELMVA